MEKKHFHRTFISDIIYINGDSGWLRQADRFYTNLLTNAELLNRLKVNGVTVGELKAGHANVKKVEQGDIAYKEAIGIAQDAKEKRDGITSEFPY